MSRLILFVLADSSRERIKRELQNEKFLPIAGFEPTISRLLDWRSYVLNYWGSDCRHLKVNDIYILIAIEFNEILTKYDLKDKPQLKFNVNEEGVQQNNTPPGVVAGIDACVQEVTFQKSSTTTIMGCRSASGIAILPYAVFTGARIRQKVTCMDVSRSRWHSIRVWVVEFRHFSRLSRATFFKHVLRRGLDSILLILDGHKSHVLVGLAD